MIWTFGSDEVSHWCHGAHCTFHFQSVATQPLLVYDADDKMSAHLHFRKQMKSVLIFIKYSTNNFSWKHVQTADNSPAFSCSIFSRILPANPLLWPHITVAPSVVTPVSSPQGGSYHLHILTPLQTYFPVVVVCMCRKNPRTSSVLHRVHGQLGNVRCVRALVHSEGI